MSVGVHAHVCVCFPGSQKRTLNCLELGSQTAVSCPMCVLGMALKCPARATGAPNH